MDVKLAKVRAINAGKVSLPMQGLTDDGSGNRISLFGTCPYSGGLSLIQAALSESNGEAR